jgi:tetratricopeptide (TPR) repeat protein
VLETIRDYALERLENDPEHDTVSRHAEWFLRLAKQADEHLHTDAQTVWLSRLHADTDNLRAVPAWSLQQDIALGVELATTLLTSWRVRGQSHELIPWLERALASPTTTDMRTRAVGLLTFARALMNGNKYSRAREPLEESLALLRSLADRSEEAGVLLDLGTVAWSEGSFDTAMGLSEEALAIYRDAGNRYEIAHTLHRIGDILRDSGDVERGMATLEEALAIVDELGDSLRLR